MKDTILADHVRFNRSRLISNSLISFNLEDFDKVLRIEAKKICITTVIEELQKKGIMCEIMDW